MKKRGIIRTALIFTILVIPTFASADCADLERYTGWALETSHSVIFYDRKTPLARVEFQDCEIRPLSRIRLLSSYVCESDKIEVDGEACHIITIKVLD
jgi:hypothetical protein